MFVKLDISVEETPFAIGSISVKGRYAIIEGWAFVTVARLSQVPKLLL